MLPRLDGAELVMGEEQLRRHLLEDARPQMSPGEPERIGNVFDILETGALARGSGCPGILGFMATADQTRVDTTCLS